MRKVTYIPSFVVKANAPRGFQVYFGWKVSTILDETVALYLSVLIAEC